MGSSGGMFILGRVLFGLLDDGPPDLSGEPGPQGGQMLQQRVVDGGYPCQLVEAGIVGRFSQAYEHLDRWLAAAGHQAVESNFM